MQFLALEFLALVSTKNAIQSIIGRAHRDGVSVDLLSVGKLFFGQSMLLAKNVVKGSGQYKFGPAYRYHLSLVTKNIMKVY